MPLFDRDRLCCLDLGARSERTFVLTNMMKGFVHRVDYSTVKHHVLPNKSEFVVFVRLSPLQKQVCRCLTTISIVI